MVAKMVNMLITCREHNDQQKKLIIIVITACCATRTHLHGVSLYLQSVQKSSHSNRMGLSILWYAPCKHVLHRQPLWHTQMCIPYIYNTIPC